jgi:hypothetical protein
MKRAAVLFCVLLSVASCSRESIGPLNGVLVVHSQSLTGFIDSGGLDPLRLTVETVDPEPVFSFAFVSAGDFSGTLRERRTILMLLDQQDGNLIPSGTEPSAGGVFHARDVWARNQQVFSVILDPNSPNLPEELPGLLERAYHAQMEAYIYRSFVSTTMTSPERIDSIGVMGFTVDVPKSYVTHRWAPEDGFVQFQRQPDDESLILFSLHAVRTLEELTPESAIFAREAMARRFFFDAGADSVDRARVFHHGITLGGLSGWQLTGVWRNPEYLNAGSFTTRVLDHGEGWYILDVEVYNPGRVKEPFLREGWVIMDTFRKE